MPKHGYAQATLSLTHILTPTCTFTTKEIEEMKKQINEEFYATADSIKYHSVDVSIFLVKIIYKQHIFISWCLLFR